MANPINVKIQPDPQNHNINSPLPDGEWSRQTGVDASGRTYHVHTIKLRNSDTHDFTIKIKMTDTDELTQVLGLKALRNMFKNLSHSDAKELFRQMKEEHKFPVLITMKDKDKNVLGVVPIFPGNKESEGHYYTMQNDGSMRYFTGYKNIDDLVEGTAATLYPLFKQGDIGYDVRTRHKDKYKTAQKIDLGVSESRKDRAEYILSQFKDRAELNARRVNDAPQQQPVLPQNPAPNNEDPNDEVPAPVDVNVNGAIEDEDDARVGPNQPAANFGVVIPNSEDTSGLGISSTTTRTGLTMTSTDSGSATTITPAPTANQVSISSTTNVNSTNISSTSPGAAVSVRLATPEEVEKLNAKQQNAIGTVIAVQTVAARHIKEKQD